MKFETRFEEEEDEITIEDIKKKFDESELSKNSKIKYLGAINRVISWFDYEINDLFKKYTDKIITKINEKYPNANTRKQ